MGWWRGRTSAACARTPPGRAARGHRPGRPDHEGQRSPVPCEHHVHDRLPRLALVHRVHRQVHREGLPRLPRPARPPDRTKLHVIADRPPVHRSKTVCTWLEANAERIELHLMPGCSPELDRGELLDADIKHHVHAARATPPATSPTRPGASFTDAGANPAASRALSYPARPLHRRIGNQTVSVQ